MGATSSQVVHPDKPNCEDHMHMKKQLVIDLTNKINEQFKRLTDENLSTKERSQLYQSMDDNKLILENMSKRQTQSGAGNSSDYYKYLKYKSKYMALKRVV